MNKVQAIASIIVLVAGLSVSATWYFMRPKPVIETPAAEVKQDDGSIIAARAPDPKAKPKHKIPSGAKVERTGEVTVQGATPAANPVPCPPVTIDSTLIRNPDGSKRVILSSPDGTITRAIDIPVETAAPPPEPKTRAVGILYDPFKRIGGVFFDQDIGRVRLGVQVNQSRQKRDGPTGVEAWGKVGWAF